MPSTKELFVENKCIYIEKLENLSKNQIEILKWIKKSEEKFTLNYKEIKDIQEFQEIISKDTNFIKPDHIFEIKYNENGNFIFKIRNF